MAYRDSDTRGGKIIHKRSSVAGAPPSSGTLRPGELAVNAADGVAYMGTLSGVATIPGASGITQIVALTQAAYDALATKSSTTLYVITAD